MRLTSRTGTHENRSLPRHARLNWLWVFAFPSLGCSVVESSVTNSDALDIAEAVLWSDSVRLEENHDVVNVAITLTADGGDHFLVADKREGQVRVYGRRGNLIAHHGTVGDAPGEFRAAGQLVRLPNRDLLAIDMGGRVVVFDSALINVKSTHRTQISPLHMARVLSDSIVLLGGRRAGMDEELHLFDYRRGIVRRSFFSPASHVDRAVRGAFGAARAAATAEWLVLTHTLVDSVFIYSYAGDRLRAISFPNSDFRRFIAPPEAAGRNAAARAEWMREFDLVSGVYVVDSSLIVTYFSTEGSLTRHHAIAFRTDGQKLFEIRDMPRLLGVHGRELIFVHPGSLTPNHWAIGQMKR